MTHWNRTIRRRHEVLSPTAAPQSLTLVLRKTEDVWAKVWAWGPGWWSRPFNHQRSNADLRCFVPAWRTRRGCGQPWSGHRCRSTLRTTAQRKTELVFKFPLKPWRLFFILFIRAVTTRATFSETCDIPLSELNIGTSIWLVMNTKIHNSTEPVLFFQFAADSEPWEWGDCPDNERIIISIPAIRFHIEKPSSYWQWIILVAWQYSFLITWRENISLPTKNIFLPSFPSVTSTFYSVNSPACAQSHCWGYWPQQLASPGAAAI